MKLVRYYIYEMKFWKKMLLAFLLLILVPLIMMFLYFQVIFIHRLESNTLDMNQILLEQTASSLEAYMAQSIEIADHIAQDENLQKLLSASAEQLQALEADKSTSDPLFFFVEGIRDQIDGTEIQGIQVYCEEECPLLSDEVWSSYDIFSSTDRIRTSLWYSLLQKEENSEMIAPAFYLNSWENDKEGHLAYLKRVRYFETGTRKNAYVAVYFNRDRIGEILKGYGNYTYNALYVIDERESIVEMVGQEGFSQYILNYRDLTELVKENGQFSLVSYGDDAAWTYSLNLKKTAWKLTFVVSRDAIIRESRVDGWRFMGTYLLIALLLLIAMLFLTRSFSRRMELLRNQMMLAKNTTPEILDIPIHHDEIGELTDSYNYMSAEIHQLLEEKVKAANEISRLEMKALRAQINPHFLYNTLDMINWYAKKGATEDVVATIHALAGFYKLSLNQGRLYTSLENEIALLEKYVELQNRRARCEIELIADIPDQMLDLEIPQFLLQPIVENSLKHGILEKDTSYGVITVTGWMEESSMVLVLGDDGVGMDTSVIEEILAKKQEAGRQDRENHIGVHNIYRRLEIVYGEGNFDMTYTSVIGEGTQVTLCLPVRENRLLE